MAVVVLVEEKNKRRDLKDFELIKARSEGFKEHLIQIWGFRIRYVGYGEGPCSIHLCCFHSCCDDHSMQSKRVKNLKDAIMKSEDGGSKDDLQLIASSVVLAALSVAPYDNTRGASHLELEHEKEQNLRMANLIGFIIDPKLESREVLSRSSLLTELMEEIFYVVIIAQELFTQIDRIARVAFETIRKRGGLLSRLTFQPFKVLFFVLM
ncbi:Eukaryotic translation initiation factor 3 subunit A [Camellia lanceoleosa]|uniref:Eukaryotic translation initiation factor 3 subunit A n=1 Tax=Camellia lanceoleosa TaxID=1840588 RepID=A0ACC0H4Q6_9ERIC|nr:Eukaryotic translation initiation factor 3 subunit A [Camellia lanceoleosa]